MDPPPPLPLFRRVFAPPRRRDNFELWLLGALGIFATSLVTLAFLTVHYGHLELMEAARHLPACSTGVVRELMATRDCPALRFSLLSLCQGKA